MAPISFDGAIFELWGALLHGGSCVLWPGKVPGPGELEKVLKEHRVSTLWLTAALFNAVIEQEPQAFAELKQLLIGGEALSVRHVRKGLALLPGTEIINGYGPTESTTFACCYSVPRELHDNLSSIPIGKPIGNTQVYILDPHLNPAPIGVVGELYIGGDGLARGYLDRPDLTAEKFLPNPFSAKPGASLYGTGDLARYLPDGNIEFLGRIDHQVKLRGFRIELGEIEAVLAGYHGVADAVVLAKEDAAGHKQLNACIVAKKEDAPATRDLRAYLARKLPDFMIPSAFSFFDSLPLLPNGKVNRKALSASDHAGLELKREYVAPRTSLEKALAEIFAEVLNLARPGIDDNFFELGGDSLSATQVIARLRDAMQIELPLRCLFETPSVAELAKSIEGSAQQPGQKAFPVP
jgi:acyl-coenzyme A synthetase/AMP-(fatty) acid ligase/acyl carrier protein